MLHEVGDRTCGGLPACLSCLTGLSLALAFCSDNVFPTTTENETFSKNQAEFSSTSDKSLYCTAKFYSREKMIVNGKFFFEQVRRRPR
jgi:hypothetical protein